MEGVESRFAQLLKPIRELTQNWEVDLASQLGDYLQELEGVRISFDGGKTTMNFAEAALLLQGTTSIYGKKVELLHSLVFQTLDYISNKSKKKDKQQAAGGEDEGSQEVVTNAREDALQEELVSEKTDVNTVTLHADPSTVLEISPVPPEALIPVDALEKQEFPFLNVRGEVLGSWKDFRVCVFSVDAAGALQMGMAAFHSYFLRSFSGDDAAQPLHHTPLDMPHLHRELTGSAGMGAGDAGMGAGHAGIGEPEVEGHQEEEAGFMPLDDHGMEMDAENDEHIERHQVEGGSDRRMLRERAAVKPVAIDPKQQKEVVDVWKWHDLYTVVGEDKPLAKGRCCNVPAGLEESGKRKRKTSSKLDDFGTWCMKAYKVSDRKLKNGPSLPELNYIYLNKMKERIRARRDVLRRTGVPVSDEQLRRTYLEEEEDAGEHQEAEDPEELRHQEPDGNGVIQDSPEELGINFSPEDDCGDNEDHDMGLPSMPIEDISYEDLVKKSMAQFFANTERYAKVTALSQRVQDWEDQIRPHLAAEEERGVFDIRDYGDRVINAFSQVKEKRTFASIVAGKNNHEVCRYMLASLQLANDYTVEISKDGELEESVDTMALTLLSERRAHDRLKAYSANAGMDVQAQVEAQVHVEVN
ncbi:condensin-2 complex subunit H2 [Sardina pilchardus]|uniref:condensin-2 complex subunit H2 n=1 Tax=Sardina pilchardus TaxID=27697 RepID=UPI002E14D089